MLFSFSLETTIISTPKNVSRIVNFI